MPFKAWAFAGAAVAIVAAIGFIQLSTRNNILHKLESESNAARIENREEAEERFNDIQDLSGDEFINAIDGLPGADSVD
ncbi:MAG: hypothetical protein AAGF53_02370 [Pseudomonadota bacterium]